MNNIKVIIVEPNQEMQESLKTAYEKFFLTCNYAAEIACISTQPELDKKLKYECYDIVICDLYFNSSSLKGLDVVRETKLDYPEIYYIGNSSSDVTYNQTAIKLPTFDLFVDKQPFVNEDVEYQDELRTIFLENFCINSDIEIDNESDYGSFSDKKSKRIIRSLISQVIFSSHSHDPFLKPNHVFISPLTGGRSNSYVYKMIAKNSQSDVYTVPSVLKISEIEDYTAEYDNYNKFVKWNLPYSWRVDVLGTGKTKEYGAICYSFILSDASEFNSLTYYLEQEDYETTFSTISKIFSPSMRRWYSDKLIQVDQSISRRYYNRHFADFSTARSKSAEIFRTKIEDLYSGRFRNGKFHINGKSYRAPAAVLLGRTHGQCKTCISHGDLNSNNVIVANNKEVIFIDFQDTGRAHVYEDFINVEASIRLNYGIRNRPRVEDFGSNILIQEYKFSRNEECVLPDYYKLIAHVRTLAKQNFSSENWINYHYGLAVYCFRLLRVKGLNTRQLYSIITPILVSLEILESEQN